MKRLKKSNSEKEELFDIFSDMYKDAYGVRPHWTKEEYNNTSIEELKEEINNIEKYFDSDEYDKERERQYDMEQEYLEDVRKLKQEQQEYDDKMEDEYYDSLEKSIKKRHQASIKKKDLLL